MVDFSKIYTLLAQSIMTVGFDLVDFTTTTVTLFDWPHLLGLDLLVFSKSFHFPEYFPVSDVFFL